MLSIRLLNVSEIRPACGGAYNFSGDRHIQNLLEARRASVNGTLKVSVMEDQETLFETGNLDTVKPIIFKK